MFCNSLSAMGPPCEPFHLEIAKLSCNPSHCSSPPQYNYISACGVDKKISKIAGHSASYVCIVERVAL